MLTEEQRAKKALRGIRIILDAAGYKDIKYKIRVSDGRTEMIDCCKEIENYIDGFYNIQQKFANMDIKLLLNSILDIDSKSENPCFPVVKKFRILTDEDYDKLNNYESPQPYQSENLKVGMWVFDTKPDCEEFTFFKITKILSEDDCEYLYHDKNKKVFFDNMVGHAREFEDGRFYPPTKALQYQK